MAKVDLVLLIVFMLASLAAGVASMFFLWNSGVFWEVFGFSTLASVFASLSRGIIGRCRG